MRHQFFHLWLCLLTGLSANHSYSQSKHKVLIENKPEATEERKFSPISIGDQFELKFSIEAISLQSGEIFNKDGGGLRDHILEVLDNDSEEARSHCSLPESVQLKSKPCPFGYLIKLVEHRGKNLAPKIGTCFCTGRINLQSQPRLIKPKSPLDSKGEPFEFEEIEDTNLEEIEIEEYERPQAKVLSGKSALAVYRPNGTLAKNYENLEVEIINSKPVVRENGDNIYLARLWKPIAGTDQVEAFNHRSIYGVRMKFKEAKPHLPKTNVDHSGHPQVFKQIAKRTGAGTKHVPSNTPPSASQRKLIDQALKGAKPRSLGLCATYVKRAMQKALGLPYVRCDGFEVDLTYDLESKGFELLDTLNPNEAPPGAIIIYDSFARRGSYKNRPGGRSADDMRVDFPSGQDRRRYVPYYGHIEVKTDDPDYPFVSDFKQRSSVITHSSKSDITNGWGFNRTQSREYKVVGIYYKR